MPPSSNERCVLLCACVVNVRQTAREQTRIRNENGFAGPTGDEGCCVVLCVLGSCGVLLDLSES